MKAFRSVSPLALLALTLMYSLPSMSHAAGGPGEALRFSGGGAVSIDHHQSLNAYPITVTAWFRTTQVTLAGLVTKGHVAAPGGWRVFLEDHEIRAAYEATASHVGGGNNSLRASGLPVDTWHHVAFTVDENGGRLYVDGVQRDAQSWNGPPAPVTDGNPLRLGAFSGSGFTFEGLVDEVTVWNVALTQSQVQSNMNRILRGDEPGLLAYYRCDSEGSADELKDGAPGAGDNFGRIEGQVMFVPSSISPFTPYVETSSAASLTLNGMVNPLGTNTSAWFEWGTTTDYGRVTPGQSMGRGTTSIHFSQALTGLTSGIYHFRAVASNSLGTVFGVNKSFTLPFPGQLPEKVVFSENFDVDRFGYWKVNPGPGTGAADFFFDYSSVGIPPAPNSAGTTRGLKLEANYEDEHHPSRFTGLSVSPCCENFTGDYVLTFDIWWNFLGPAPQGDNGSTQITGAGIGTAGASPQWAGAIPDCVYFGVTGDGGGLFDYRAYSTAAPTHYQGGSVYAASGTLNTDNTHPYYAALGGNTPPAAQTALFGRQTGTTAPGAPGFRWHAGKIAKAGANITFSLNDLLIATVVIGSTHDTNRPPVSLAGGKILFTHFDVNSESATNEQTRSLQFGLIDNVQVTQQYPRLHHITPLKNGQLQLVGSGVPGSFYAIQASSLLSSGWINIGGVTADSSGVIFFVDPQPAVPSQRFYRLLSL